MLAAFLLGFGIGGMVVRTIGWSNQNFIRIGVDIMKKKPLSKRIKSWIVRKIINPIKYRNVKWCFDESECTNKNKNCNKCDYYIDYNK
jgi:hypothetical protein